MSIAEEPLGKEMFERGSAIVWKGASLLGGAAAGLVTLQKSPAEKKLFNYKASYLTGVPLTSPRGISVELSTACNLHCRICHQWKDNRDRQTLDAADLHRIIDDIAAHFPEAILEFSGQEPTMNAPLLFDSLEYAQARGVRTALNTNGMVVDRAFAARLIGARPHHISVSLDGARAETHDDLRNMHGSYIKVVRAIANLLSEKRAQDADTAIAITSVLCNNNLEEMPAIHALGRELGVDSINYNAFVLDNSYFIGKEETHENCEFWIHGEERLEVLQRVIDALLAIKQGGETPLITNDSRQLANIPEYFRSRANFSRGKCLAGYNYFHIHKLGDVTVCGKGPFLNVKQYSLYDIWHSYAFYKTRQVIKQCDNPCLNNCFTLL